jgi:ankyrin repeat protein
MLPFFNYFSDPTTKPKNHVLLQKIATPFNDTNKQKLTVEIQEYLSQNHHSISKTVLSQALSNSAFLGDRSEIIKLLAQYNADPNFSNFCGHSPLHLATSSGYAKTCSTLLALKANPNAINKFAQTPNQYAINCALDENPNERTSAAQNLCIKLNNMAADLDSTDLASLIEHGNTQIAIVGNDAYL